MSGKAVILMAHGAASGPDGIGAYLSCVLGGRPAPERLIREVAERCRLIGGKSPLVDITLAQAEALSALLNERHHGDVSVRAGMLYSQPSIESAVEGAAAEGCGELAAVPMTPYRSVVSFSRYMERLESAVNACVASMKVSAVRDWHRHPMLVRVLADKLRQAVDRIPERLRGGCEVLFTAHTLPKGADDGSYESDLRDTAAAVAREALRGRWRLAFQSRPAGPGEWLGPDVRDVLGKMAAEGVKSVALSPIGFVSDNLETLYDCDILARSAAEESGMYFVRAGAPNGAPAFIRMLAELVSAGAGRP